MKVGDRVRLVEISRDRDWSKKLKEYTGDTGGEVLRISRYGSAARVLWDTGRAGSYMLTSLLVITGLDIMLEVSFGD